jgi:hypothetical protein
MAVDYASKRRERNNEGWALRNAKLRMSRKLLFVSGLIMCLRCPLKGVILSGPDFTVEPLINFLTQYVERTPLDIVSEILKENGSKATAAKIFQAYDEFIGIVSDVQRRKELSEVPYNDVEKSVTFREIKRIGASFQQGLEDMFFNDNRELAAVVRTYGTF